MTNNPNFSFIGIDPRTAYRHAGQAISIYLGNKLKKLPDVYFKIHIGPHDRQPVQVHNSKHHSVFIEGGRLVDNDVLLLADTRQFDSLGQREQYRHAFEADITNILVGALTEAKYVAKLENRRFDAQALPSEVLTEYGDASDLAVIEEYRQLYRQDGELKLIRLMRSALNFVENPLYWEAIKQLARSIQKHIMSSISYEQVSAMLKPHLSHLASQHRWPYLDAAKQSTIAISYG